ncbi:MAG: DUF1404 family protein [Thermoplasmata archaeon]
MNLPFVLTEGTFGEVRVRLGPPGSSFLLETFVLILITPILAIEAIPIALLLHVLAISTLHALALERTVRRGGPVARAVTLIGLGFALTAPVPGLYAYPNPFASLITLIPGSLIPVVSFFASPFVRYGFVVLAYGLPVIALLLAHLRGDVPSAVPRRPSPIPAYLLPTLMVTGLFLIVGGTDTLKVIGLIWNWAVMVAGLLLWSLYYRPAMPSLRFPPDPSAFERRLTAWRRPLLAFGVLTVLLLLLTGLPPVDAFVEANALGHHAQHVTLLLVGLMMGGLIWQQARTHRRDRNLTGEASRFVYASNVLFNPHGAVGMAFAVAAVAFWHVPFFWDLALTNDLVHVLEHFSLIAAGSAVAFSLGLMRSGGKYGLLVGGTIVMSVLALTLWFTSVPVYATYPLAQLSTLGMVHFILGAPLMIFAIGIAVTALLRMRPSSDKGDATS